MSGRIVSVGINGFGAVGRSVFYAALQDPTVVVVAINDTSLSPACLAYMMERECPAHLPRLRAQLVAEGVIAVNGAQRIIATQETRPTTWAAHGAQVVLECSGTNTTRDRCATHLAFGAQYVLVAAHSTDAPLAVPGVRPLVTADADGRPVRVHSGGCPPGALLAPLLHRLDASLGLEEVVYTVVSGVATDSGAVAAAGRSADPRDWRQLRLQQSAAAGTGAFAPSVAQTGVPTLHRILPALDGKLSATAFEVTGHRGCAVDLFVRTAKAATKEELDTIVAGEAAEGSAVAIAETARNGAMLSTDCVGRSRLVYEADASATLSSGHSHKLLLWVDLEWAYATQLVSLAKMLPCEPHMS